MLVLLYISIKIKNVWNVFFNIMIWWFRQPKLHSRAHTHSCGTLLYKKHAAIILHTSILSHVNTSITLRLISFWAYQILAIWNYFSEITRRDKWLLCLSTTTPATNIFVWSGVYVRLCKDNSKKALYFQHLLQLFTQREFIGSNPAVHNGRSSL